MRTPPWSSRNKLLWTPPGPEGSNGNDKFMCRDVAKVVLFLSHRIFRSSILREDWFVRSCEEMVFKDSPSVYINSISFLGVQRHFLRCCAILSIPKYFPIIATSMLRILFSDIVVTLLKCRVTRSKQTELIRMLLKKAILPIRDGLMTRFDYKNKQNQTKSSLRACSCLKPSQYFFSSNWFLLILHCDCDADA